MKTYLISDSINLSNQNDYIIQNPVYLKNTDHYSLFLQKSLYGEYLRDGEYGCSFAHYCIYKKMVDNNVSYALILEEDFKQINNLNNLDPLIENNFLHEPSIVILGLSRHNVKNTWWLWMKHKFNKKISYNNIDFGIANTLTSCGTVAYIINNNAAQIIIQSDKIFWRADDFNFFRKLGINVYFSKSQYFIENFTISKTGNGINLFHNIFSKFFALEFLEFIYFRLLNIWRSSK